ncbi:MAG: glucose-6-phosphate isomerase [Gemmatimonadota bacterium]
MNDLTGWSLDYANALADALGGRGPTPQNLQSSLRQEVEQAQGVVASGEREGRLGFMELPGRQDLVAAVQGLADGFGQWFETVVVIGIGGSALGAWAMRDALLGPYWNERSAEARDYFPRLYFLDNPDPAVVSDLLAVIEPTRTLFNVVSKSGSTAETMALYLVMRRILDQAVGADAARGHFVFTTDPERGPLRELAQREGIPTLAVPGNVGGRFSVLSPVGLFPAALTGIDLRALMAGAAAMDQRCRSPELEDNPAALLAALLHAWDVEHGTPIHVLMPYSSRLRSFALWFQQLWAESLGKEKGGEGIGPTPLPAVGATDQHAQVQLFMEGPRDKCVVFLAVRDFAETLTIPDVHTDVEAARYLSGHSVATLLDTERRATTEALRQRGRPSLTLTIPALDTASLGGLFQLFEHATVLAGALYGVDPLDQPGVELGKRLTYGLLGRAGHEIDPLPPERTAHTWQG